MAAPKIFQWCDYQSCFSIVSPFSFLMRSSLLALPPFLFLSFISFSLFLSLPSLVGYQNFSFPIVFPSFPMHALFFLFFLHCATIKFSSFPMVFPSFPMRALFSFLSSPVRLSNFLPFQWCFLPFPCVLFFPFFFHVQLFSSKRAPSSLNTAQRPVHVDAEAVSFHLPKPVMGVCFFFHKENVPLSSPKMV